MELNQEFLIEIFYTFCKRPKHRKYQNVFNAECPVCKEGKSAGRSRRLFYFPNKQYFYCHNCAKSWKPFEWVKEISGLTVPEILRRNKTKAEDSGGTPIINKPLPPPRLETEIADLPDESVDLTDPRQMDFYKNNKFVKIGLEYCKKRRLFTAVNSCKKFYVSVGDKIHKNRLVIPFYDQNGKISCYQTRSLLDNQFPRYLTKYGEKDLFNVSNINPAIPYVFVFEGPIDSMFVSNGVAIASLTPTEKQENTLRSFLGYNLIYVFDNDKQNGETKRRVEKHIQSGKAVFIWPQEFRAYKDFNEVCCNLGIDEIPWKFVVKHSAKGAEALIKHKLLTKK